MKRHWSFIACDKKYLFPFTTVILIGGIFIALYTKDYSQFSRVGNFIIGIGVWMSMRYTLREGINKNKNMLDQYPIDPHTKKLNADFFNKIAFSLEDARLQIYGFILVVLGSIVGSYGDIILKYITDFTWCNCN